jgi:hypothetical protein
VKEQGTNYSRIRSGNRLLLGESITFLKDVWRDYP